MGSASGKLCFAAGTVILLNEGRKAIEDIVVGDYVWAWDEETGEKTLRRVTETYVNQTSELVHVFVGGEEIITTPTHPFYSPVKGWTEAAQLRAGDILVLVNGEYVVVEKVQHEILESPINVYNFQVAGDQTYYVSDIGVLVHNACPEPSSQSLPFKSDDLLMEHYTRHNPQMGNMFSSPEEYLEGANYVIQNGFYVESKNAYVLLHNLGRHENYLFVGLTRDGNFITTFMLKAAKKIFK